MAPRRFRKLRLVLVLCFALSASSPLLAAEGLAAEPGQTLAALEETVSKLEAMVADAHFRRAIRGAESAREWADEIPRSPASKRARARLEVLLCTAQVALGKGADARRSMGRAVYVWPLLQLDESDTSPRVVKLFREVRGGGGSKRATR